MSGFIAAADAQAIFCFSPPEILKMFLFNKSLIFKSFEISSILFSMIDSSIPWFSGPNAISLVVFRLKNCERGF